jgi:hypothetical protein
MFPSNKSQNLVVIIVSALLAVPSLLIWFFLTGARFPNVFVADTHLGVSLIVFCFWLALAVWFASRLIMKDDFHPKPFLSFLLFVTSLSAFGFFGTSGSEWIYPVLPAVSSSLILWQTYKS